MDKTPPQNAVASFRLTPRVAEKRIREAAQDSALIDWGLHTLDRMAERDIPDAVVLRALREGFAKGNLEMTPRGEWKCKMVYPMRGARDVGVLVVIRKSGSLFLKTVEWEDLK
jgi:hypothetical protein